MKGLLLIRRLFPEAKHNPCFTIDYEIAHHPGRADTIVMLSRLAYPGFSVNITRPLNEIPYRVLTPREWKEYRRQGG